MTLAEITPDDYDALLQLNTQFVHYTSPLDEKGLTQLVRQSVYAKSIKRAGSVLGFLLCLDETAAYDSDNFLWFKARFKHFWYIDRIIVASEAQGQGIAARLYDDVIANAKHNATERIVCEYDLDPPNIGSKALHDRFGFSELGQQVTQKSQKRVSMQSMLLIDLVA